MTYPYAQQTWSDNDPRYPLSASRLRVIEDALHTIDTSSSFGFDITRFGAVNSDTDTYAVQNSIAIQAAYDYCNALNPSGGVVYIPPGVFRIWNPIVPRAAVTTIGTGVNSQIKIAANRNIDVFDSGPNLGLFESRFENFSVNCNSGENSGHGLANYTGQGFVGSYSFCQWNKMEIVNTAFRGWDLNWPFRGDGWPVSGGYQNNIRFSTCSSTRECIYVHYPVTDSSWGPGNSLSAGETALGNIVVEGGPHRIYQNHFHGTPIHNVYSEGASIISVQDCIMEQAQQENINLNLGSGGGDQGWIWKITGNSIQSNAIDISPGFGNPGYGDPIPDTYDAVYLHSEDATSKIGPILVANNTFRTINAKYAVHVKKGTHIQIVDNILTQGDGYPAYMQSVPIKLESGCTDIEIHGNTPSNKFDGTGANRNSGRAKVLTGNSGVVVAHGLGVTPTKVVVTPADNPDPSWPYVADGNRGATNFDISLSVPAVRDISFDWEAWID